tara:strand:+ start:3518 stop:5014 length:1497 start_codon:yes stop_codon:yes gene_type:complete
MKKIKLNIIIPIVVLLMTAISCSDDLDRFPYNSIVSEQSFQTFADAENWNNTFFAGFRGRVSGLYQISTDIQGDQLNATIDYGNRNGSPHRMDESFLADDYTIRDTWSGYYSTLRNVNVAIAGFETFDFEDPAERASLNIFKGNAHFVRAYYYFQLVNRFANVYNPSTADTDLGVPLVLEYDVNATPSRSTVQDVYNQILDDLQIASTALSGEAGSQGSNYFNKDVVKALEARIKLTMQDWVGAKAAADLLIGSGTYPLITSQAGLANMWTNDFAQEVIYQPFVSAPDELAPTNGGIYLGYNGGSDTYTPDFLPSQWVIDMYDDADYRKDVYFTVPNVVRFSNGDYTDLTVVNKFPGNPALFTGVNTNYQHAPKVFRIAEMYLISAEAALNIPGGDAATPLNALRDARNVPTIPSPTMQDLKDERFRELAFEGFRLDDIKRWGDAITRSAPQNTGVIELGPNFNLLSKPAGTLKFTWGIPSRDMTVNPGLKGQQNPGW